MSCLRPGEGSGADLYAGDAVETEATGSLRLKIGATQVFLRGASSAAIVQKAGKVLAQLKAGTLAFSTTHPDEFAVETPLGLVRGVSGQRVFGQVSILSPKHAVISAYDGTFVLEGDCGSRSIHAGENYDVSLSSDKPCSLQVVRATTSPVNWGTVAKGGAVAGSAAGTAAYMWLKSSDTCSSTSTC